MTNRRSAVAACAAILLSSCVGSPAPDAGLASAGGSAERCQALAGSLAVRWPDASTHIAGVTHHQTGLEPQQAGGRPGMATPPAQLPAHCEITGVMQERRGVDGQDYAIRFHLRLPDAWNGRFLMQGGGGTNGVLGDAVGRIAGSSAPALAQGYAVLSQDSGHDNARNSVAERNGASAFGFDPQARADYGGDSLEKTARAALAAIGTYYGTQPRYSYFFGCSKGGQEGMVLAQQYPDLFDGIVAAAPGFSLPRAAIGEMWNTQAFASVLEARNEPVTLTSLGASFSPSDLRLVGEGVAAACDGLDGQTDGFVAAYRQCTSARVLPELAQRQCSSGKADGCLSGEQIAALEQIHGGARDSAGRQIYRGFAWDAGWGDMGWRIWMIGAPDGGMPAINVAMGAPSLAAVFSSPARAFGTDPAAPLTYALGYDFDRNPAEIDAVVAPFRQSAWADISARSSNLDAFRARGGRLIVPHGVSDPVFSINDTTDWWDELDQRYGGQGAQFARVFPVSGMGHCQGGPATDRFDAFAALVDWVENGVAPDRLVATSGQRPGISRPLCPHPQVARYTGGDPALASSFTCSAS